MPRQPADFRSGSIRQNLEAALQWLQEGAIRVDALFALQSPKECQQAYQDLLHGRNEKLATIFDWTQLSQKETP